MIARIYPQSSHLCRTGDDLSAVLGKSLARSSVMVNSQLLPTVKPQVRAHMPTAANEPQTRATDSGPTPLRRPFAPSGTGHLPRLPNHPEATHRTRAPAPVPGQRYEPSRHRPVPPHDRRNPHQPTTFGPRPPALVLLGGGFLFVVVVKTLVATMTDSVLLPAVHVPSRFACPTPSSR